MRTEIKRNSLPLNIDCELGGRSQNLWDFAVADFDDARTHFRNAINHSIERKMISHSYAGICRAKEPDDANNNDNQHAKPLHAPILVLAQILVSRMVVDKPRQR